MDNVSNNKDDEVNEPKKKGTVTRGFPRWMQGGGAIIFGFKRPANFGIQSSTQEPQKATDLKSQVDNTDHTDLIPRNIDPDDN